VQKVKEVISNLRCLCINHNERPISTIISTGTAAEKGSGLGLILCKEFVEKQGGHIWVESAEGKGSDFKFTLPLYK